MLKHWLIDLIGHASGLSDAQLRQIEKSLPASKALIDLLNRAEPFIEQAQKLYAEAEPLIDEAMKEWQTVGPAAQILIDLISHHVSKGASPAEAAEALRAALDGSIKIASDHWIRRWRGQRYQPVRRARKRYISFRARGSSHQDREGSAAGRGQTANSHIRYRHRRGLALALYSQSRRRRGGRADRVSWRPSGRVVRAG